MINKIEQIITSKRCPKCSSRKLFKLADGRYKCANCNFKYSSKKIENDLKILHYFSLEIPANKAAKDLGYSYPMIRNKYMQYRNEILPKRWKPLFANAQIFRHHSELSPVAVGKALGANIILLVIIEDYQLGEVAETDYYRGFLHAQTVLFETATAEKLWTESAEGKGIRVGFEAEQREEASVKRLVNACAHCISRYFYNCTKDKFKIFDERSDTGWEEWKK